jgi:hypothetical protein
MNIDLVFRDENGGFVDNICQSKLKSLFNDSEINEITLTSWYENDSILRINKFRNNGFYLNVNDAKSIHNHFPEKKIFAIIKDLQIDTITIN